MTPVLPLLQQTWRLYKEHFSLFLGYATWILVPYLLIIVAEVSPIPADALAMIQAILYAIQLFLVIWVVAIITTLTFALVRKKTIDLSVLGKKTWKKVVPLILVAILTGLITLGGFILLIVPGFIFFVWYSFAQMEVILHKKRGWAALSASHELVRGRFWQVAWRVTAGPLVLLLGYFFITAIILALTAVLTATPESAFLTQPLLWQEVIMSVVETIALPLFTIYSTLLYLDVRSTHSSSSTLCDTNS